MAWLKLEKQGLADARHEASVASSELDDRRAMMEEREVQIDTKHTSLEHLQMSAKAALAKLRCALMTVLSAEARASKALSEAEAHHARGRAAATEKLKIEL
jgi:hypothetical protein